jgi:hypothetical protein
LVRNPKKRCSMVKLKHCFWLAWLLPGIGSAKHQAMENSETRQSLFRKVG